MILQFNSTYYYWGMGYGECAITPDGCTGLFFPPHCGYRDNHTLSLYSSPDLRTWTYELDALPLAARPLSVYFRPQVVYNPATQTLVLWINRVSFFPGTQVVDYLNATYLVATSPSPLTPFTVAHASVATRYSAAGVGDVALFVDPRDGAGYVAYAAWAAPVHAVSIERLSPDFLTSAAAAEPANGTGPTPASAGVVTPPFYEAPLLLFREGAYYLISGPVCCFCAAGVPSRVWASTAGPLGPWVDTGRYLDPPGAANASLLGAQNSLLVHATLANGSQAIVWAGDRWGSAPDGLFGHNLQYWGLTAWDDSASPPLPLQLQWLDTLVLDL